MNLEWTDLDCLLNWMTNTVSSPRIEVIADVSDDREIHLVLDNYGSHSLRDFGYAPAQLATRHLQPPPDLYSASRDP